MLKFEFLEECPKDTIYVFPDTLRCPDCSEILGKTIYVLASMLDGSINRCVCGYFINPEALMRQIGVLKNVK